MNAILQNSPVKGEISPNTVKIKQSIGESHNRAKSGYKCLKKYTFLNRIKNPDFDEGVKFLDDNRGLPFESCLLTNKSDRILDRISVKTRPKWYTDLLGWEVDQETGEMIPVEIYRSDDFKAANGRKIKSLDKFCEVYQPLYQQKKCTLFFLTFTSANNARIIWRDMVHLIKKRYEREGIKIRGFIWTAEVSEKLHWHYHLCLATDRVQWKKIPARMKFEKLWGQRTEIDFVKKNVRHYMAKYFAKCDARVIGQRSYGKSIKYL